MVLLAVLALLALTAAYIIYRGDDAPSSRESGGSGSINLPPPSTIGAMSVEEALSKRRSVRSYGGRPLTLPEASQLLYSAQGLTAGWGGRTAPSAGGTYPLEAYLVAGGVEGISPGAYHYLPNGHKLEKTVSGDVRANLDRAALGQGMITDAPATVVLTARYNRTTQVYGARGVRYADMEAGHAGQNIYLQAQALGLGTVSVGAFNDQEVRDALNLPTDETPLYMFPVGGA